MNITHETRPLADTTDARICEGCGQIYMTPAGVEICPNDPGALAAQGKADREAEIAALALAADTAPAVNEIMATSLHPEAVAEAVAIARRIAADAQDNPGQITPEAMTAQAEHKVTPLDATETGFACSCGVTFTADAGFAICPKGPQPCKCYSCDGQCGGTDHPGWCGPTVPDPEGRRVCQACRAMALVWGDDRTGVQARVTQDRVRVTVKFGESAWLEPNSARALAVALVALACQLEASHEAPR